MANPEQFSFDFAKDPPPVSRPEPDADSNETRPDGIPWKIEPDDEGEPAPYDARAELGYPSSRRKPKTIGKINHDHRH